MVVMQGFQWCNNGGGMGDGEEGWNWQVWRHLVAHVSIRPVASRS